jgi:benzodiazapine receptor
MTLPTAPAPAATRASAAGDARTSAPTRSDRVRQVAVLITFLVTIALNSAANALPLNGQLTGEISDRFRVFVVPAGYVFAIWGLIYAFQLAFLVHTLRPSRAADPLLRRLGLLPAAAALFNAGWIVAWHWEVFPLTLVLMVGLLASLIAIYLRGGLGEVARPGSGVPAATRWLVQVPFSIYLGWITVATIANVAAVGNWANVPTFGVEVPLIAAVVLVTGVGIAATAVARTADAAYAAVIVWAYTGLVVKEAAAATPYVPLVAGASVVAIILVLLAAIVRHGRASGTLTGVRGIAAPA